MLRALHLLRLDRAKPRIFHVDPNVIHYLVTV